MTSVKPQRISWNFLNPFDIRKGEGKKTFLMLVYFFLTMTVLYVLKPVRSSLFLEELGSQNLRYVYLGEGLFLLFVTWAYVHLAKLLPKKQFFSGVLLVFISNLVLFWWLFHIKVPYLSAFFYVWVACFSITAVTQFWTLANDLFDPLEAKRLFGLIISGGSAGGVVGGLVTNRAVRWLRTEDLLLVSAFILGICIFLIYRVWRIMPSTPGEVSARGASTIEVQSTRKLFATSPYLWMLAGIVMMAKAASTIVDNQFNAVVESHLLGKEAKTAFFGVFSAGLNVVSLLMQLWATRLCLRFLGVGISLTLLPLGLTLASAVTFIYPLLLTGTLLKIFDGSMNYSIQQASKEVLYLPLASGVRYRAKPVIDMLVFRASKSLGGLLIILLAPLFAIPNERIGILVVGLIPVWLILVWKMKQAYLVLLRRQLQKGKTKDVSPPRRATEVLSFLYDEKSLGKLQSFLTQESTTARKMAAAACLAYYQSGKDLKAARQLVSELIHREALEGIPGEGPGEKVTSEEKSSLDELLLREAEKEISASGKAQGEVNANDLEIVLDRLLHLLGDPKQGMAEKRKAARFLGHRTTQTVMDGLLETLSRTQEHTLRFLLIRTLLRLRDRNSSLRWDRGILRKEIVREGDLYRKLQKLRFFYQAAPRKKEEFLEVALAAMAEESLDRLFRCLRFFYPGDVLEIIYERLVEHEQPDAIRSHAIELLQNLLGPELYSLVLEVFEEEALRTASEEEVVAILEEMIVSEDRWLSLMARFLVTELGLETRWPRLGSLPSAHTFESLDV